MVFFLPFIPQVFLAQSAIETQSGCELAFCIGRVSSSLGSAVSLGFGQLLHLIFLSIVSSWTFGAKISANFTS